MFKLFEKDKCVSLKLDTSTTLDPTTGANLVDVAPGMMLYNGANGAVPAANTTGDGPWSVTVTNAGRFFICNDYYNNTIKSGIVNTTSPIVAQTNIPSGMVAAIPIMETFEAVIPIAHALSKGDLLSYVGGVWDIADTNELAFLMVTESNGYVSGAAVDTKVTSWMHKHVVAQ